MQMEYLREFVAVVDEGSMCHAARKLFITQSVLSKHMQNLEKEFDSQLFMRTATGIRPTPLGHKAYSAFRSIIDEYDDFCVQAHDDRNHMSGQLSIGILGADIDRYLGPCIHDFSQANPNVSIAYKTEKPQEIVADLLENRLDIGFAPQKSLEDKGLLSYQVIAEDPIKFVMPKDCPAAIRGYAVPEDIADKTLVVHTIKESTDLLNGLVFSAGFLPKGTTVVDEIEVVATTVGNMDAFFIAPDFMCDRFLSSSRVSVVEFSVPLSVPLFLAYRSKGTSPIANAFLKCARRRDVREEDS